MARKTLIHKHTNQTTTSGGVLSPKLPTVGTLQKGEIAVNYKNGYETLSIENDQGEVVPFASLEQIMSYVDNSLPDLELSSNYSTSDLENENLQLAEGDSYEEAFSKLEKAILDNEQVVAASLNDLNDKKIEIDDVPTKTSQLTNDSGFLTSHQQLKTINNESLIGSGNITIQGGGGDTNIIETIKVNGTALTPDSNKAVDITVPAAITESTVSGWGFTKNTGTYSKPNGGIPKSDLANSVQTSLGKADTALQSFTESDPTVPSHVKEITTTDISNWNNKLSSAPVTSVNGQTGAVNLALGDTNIIETIQVNGTALTPDANKAVDIVESVHVYPITSTELFEDLAVDTVITGVTSTDLDTDIANGKLPILLFKVSPNAEPEPAILGYYGANQYYFYNVLENQIFYLTLEHTSQSTTLTVEDRGAINIIRNLTINGSTKKITKRGNVNLGTYIESVKVNNTALIPDANKAVDITVPTTLDSISDGTTRKLSNYLPLSGGTMTGAITVASGDGKGLLFSTTSNINVSGTTNTILGFYNGTYIIGHTAYPVNIRGTNTRPNYNGNQLALYSDIPSEITESTVSEWGFTKNTGTVTGVKMNGTTNNPTNGVVDLGTVLTSFTETDPTVPAWAKAANKPSYTAAEVGALPDTTVIPAAPGTLNTTATTAQSTSSSEALSGNITLHKVAKTGTYNDLIGKPTIPAAQVQSDWNATSGMGAILNKPTIPTVNDATLTIQKNGTTVNTFTANASSNVTANIQVNELPTVSSSDNGKILQVVNGAWALVTPVTVYIGTSTPNSSQGINGDLYVQTS